MPAKHIAIYVRVSTNKQDQASQEPDLKLWADNQTQPVKWYRDKATGKTMDRPDWERIERAIKDGEVSGVTVWRLDRLGRTASGLTKLFEDWSRSGINLVSIKDAVDLSTPAGRLMANVLASVAAYETEVRRERVAAGLAVAKERGTRSGKAIGRPKATVDKPAKLLKVTAEQVALANRLKSEGASIASIARSLSLSRPTVYRLLDTCQPNA